MTKKRDIERELLRAGWKRTVGTKHDKFVKDGVFVTVPRHKEIPNTTAEGIRKEAGLR